MHRLGALLSASTLLVLVGCPSDKPGDDESGATCEAELEQIRQDILVPKCALPSCHGGDKPAAALDFSLSSEEIATQLVGISSGVCADSTRVVPGDPEASLFIAKLHDPPPCGEQMPIDDELSDAEIACLSKWVEEVESSCETCGGGLCVNLLADAQNCGACGNACPEGVACQAGACACPSGTQLCDGACVDTASDPQHCGECGQACQAGELCSEGGCASTCEAPLEECGGGCVDTQTSPSHCGGCDMPCGQGLSCIDGACGCGAEVVSFAAQIQPLFDDSCALGGCHAPPQVQLALDLRVGKSYASLISVPSSECADRPRVEPGNPGNSYLLDKLNGVSLCDGAQMPLNGDPLSPEQIALVSDWICQGAPDN